MAVACVIRKDCTGREIACRHQADASLLLPAPCSQRWAQDKADGFRPGDLGWSGRRSGLPGRKQLHSKWGPCLEMSPCARRKPEVRAGHAEEEAWERSLSGCSRLGAGSRCPCTPSPLPPPVSPGSCQEMSLSLSLRLPLGLCLLADCAVF